MDASTRLSVHVIKTFARYHAGRQSFPRRSWRNSSFPDEIYGAPSFTPDVILLHILLLRESESGREDRRKKDRKREIERERESVVTNNTKVEIELEGRSVTVSMGGGDS